MITTLFIKGRIDSEQSILQSLKLEDNIILLLNMIMICWQVSTLGNTNYVFPLFLFFNSIFKWKTLHLIYLSPQAGEKLMTDSQQTEWITLIIGQHSHCLTEMRMSLDHSVHWVRITLRFQMMKSLTRYQDMKLSLLITTS